MGVFDDLLPAKPKGSGGVFDDLLPPKKNSVLTDVADTGLQFAQGVAQGGKMLADTFGAGNAASETFKAGADWLASNFSDQLKWEQLTSAKEAKAAELSGSTWEEIKAAGRSFGRDPVGFLVNAAGTSIPTIAAAFLPGGQGALLGRLAAMGMGAAQGAGSVKGSIYEEVEKAWRDSGASDEEAKTRASAAQEYLGSNAGQIALGTALGMVAGGTGVEGSIAAKRAGSLMSAGTSKVPQFLKEGIKEAIPEAMQGGQEKLASNLALQNEGFDQSTWGGVAGNATLEGLAGGLMGGATSPFTRRPETTTAPAPSPAAQKQAEADQALGAIGSAQDIDSALASFTKAVDVPMSLMSAPAQDPNGIDFEADPRFAGAPTFDNGTAPNQPVFGSKQAADIHIGEAGALGQLEPYEVGGGQWSVKQTEAAANAAAQANIEQWMKRAQPMPQERAQEIVQTAAETQNKAMTALPMPDGTGWTVVPRKWVSAPILADYMEQATAASQAEAERAAKKQQAAAAPVDRAPRTGSAQAVEVKPADPVDSFIAQQRSTNTPAARAYVAEFDAGRISRDEVAQRIQRETPRTDAQIADERLATAAQEAPKPSPDDLVTADGFPYGTRSGAVIRARREGLSPDSVIEVAGGYAVRTKEPANVVEPDVAGTPAQPVPAADGASNQLGGSVGAVRPVPDLREGVVRATDAPVASGGAAEVVADGGVADGAVKESRGPAASRAWVDEGKTPDQLLQDKIDGPASELASQIAEEASQQDFSPNELPQAIQQWAKDANVPADQMRETVLKKLDSIDGISDARKAQVRKAVSPLRERVQARKEAAAAPADASIPGAAVSNSKPAATSEADRFYSSLVDKASTRQLSSSGGRTLHEVQITPAMRAKYQINGRFPETPGFELRLKESVTGNPSDNGYVLIDKREQAKARQATPQADPTPPAAAAKADDGQAQEEPQEGVLNPVAAAKTKTAAPAAPSLKDRAEAMKPSREQIEMKKRLVVLNRLKECLGS